jgi:heme-degrading monooxygenase HmoA
MYAVLTEFTVAPGMWTQMARATDGLYAILKTHKGFKQAVFFADNDAGKYNSLVIWDSKESGDAAYKAIAPKTQEGLAALLKAPIVRQAFETYEPKV